MLHATGKREYQQDRYLVLPDFKPKHGGDEQVSCCLVAVFDGHKSEQAAQIAKNTMPQFLGERKTLCLLVYNVVVCISEASCCITGLSCCKTHAKHTFSTSIAAHFGACCRLGIQFLLVVIGTTTTMVPCNLAQSLSHACSALMSL